MKQSFLYERKSSTRNRELTSMEDGIGCAISLLNDDIPEHFVVLCISLFHVALIAVANKPVNDIEVRGEHSYCTH